MKTLPTWKTIVTGHGALVKELDRNCSLENTAWAMLKHLYLSTRVGDDDEREIDLVKVSGVDLGLTERSSYQTIVKLIREFGLEICPNYVGPRLRLQYHDQSRGESLTILSKPIWIGDTSLGNRIEVCEGKYLFYLSGRTITSMGDIHRPSLDDFTLSQHINPNIRDWDDSESSSRRWFTPQAVFVCTK